MWAQASLGTSTAPSSSLRTSQAAAVIAHFQDTRGRLQEQGWAQPRAPTCCLSRIEDQREGLHPGSRTHRTQHALGSRKQPRAVTGPPPASLGMRLSRAHKDGSCHSLPSSAGPEAWFGLCSEPCPRRPIQVEVDGAGTGDCRAPAPGCELGSASAQGVHQGGCDGRKELAQLPPNQSPRATLAGSGLEAAMASGLGLSADLRSGPSA